MNRWLIAVGLLGALALAGGCMSGKGVYSMPHAALSRGMAGEESQAGEEPGPGGGRMLIWRAALTVEVGDVSNAVAGAAALAERGGGYIESRSDSGEGRAHLRLRVPARTFRSTVSGIEALGVVTERSVSSEDVTEQYVDVEARLRNKVVLRDRLKQLLDKAASVSDVLAIEKELHRVQADIDSMEARLKVLKGQVDLATVDLTIERRRILGPLGLLLKGVWWGIGKLFVIRN